MRTAFIAALLTGLSGCAANSGVVPAGEGSFLVARQAATGFSGAGNLKAEALAEADQYCLNMDRSLEVIGTTEASPPYLLGNFPRAEVHFRCVDSAPTDQPES